MELWEGILWCLIVPAISYWAGMNGVINAQQKSADIDKKFREKNKREFYASASYLDNQDKVDKARGYWRSAVKTMKDGKIEDYYEDWNGDAIYAAVGCSVRQLNEHLIASYHERYGELPFDEAVHVDHIVPLQIADTPREVIALSHHSNLQLLKAVHNLEKGSTLGPIDETKLTLEIQELLAKRLA